MLFMNSSQQWAPGNYLSGDSVIDQCHSGECPSPGDNMRSPLELKLYLNDKIIIFQSLDDETCSSSLVLSGFCFVVSSS